MKPRVIAALALATAACASASDGFDASMGTQKLLGGALDLGPLPIQLPALVRALAEHHVPNDCDSERALYFSDELSVLEGQCTAGPVLLGGVPVTIHFSLRKIEKCVAQAYALDLVAADPAALRRELVRRLGEPMVGCRSDHAEIWKAKGHFVRFDSNKATISSEGRPCP